jgi:type II secretory ATPase GspE/PulE/Tfp pilus assembly ATPase PilB-like protein
LQTLDAADAEYASRFVDELFEAAQQAQVSDVHLQPTASGMNVCWRVDGVLQTVGAFPRSTVSSVVARLKVLAGLLTYRSDVPQEGRIREGASPVEIRVSTFPTLHGERAVVRLFAQEKKLARLAELGLPDEVAERLERLLHETSGMILVTGPAGSGKTTTLYAALREIVAANRGGRSIVSLEDPVESAIDGVAQSQTNEPAGFDFAVGLRSLMRQDPEVILVGEIRDEQTAEVAFQATLTGQLVLSSFHAGSAVGAITRLLDMGVAPYLLRSGLLAIVSQRLIRRLCDCSTASGDDRDRLGLDVTEVRQAAGCDRCGHTGYRGRMVLAEMLACAGSDLQQAILDRHDSRRLQEIAVASGMTSLRRRACAAVETGQTSPAEIRRVLGFRDDDAQK